MCCVLRSFNYFFVLVFSGLSDWKTYGAEFNVTINQLHNVYEQPRQLNKPQYLGAQFGGGQLGRIPGETLDQFALRQHDDRTKKQKKKFRRTTPLHISRAHYCDYFAKPCIHAYITGKICAKTIYYKYHTFETYCMMEYVNCMENQEVWQISYVGECFYIPEIHEFMHYVYHNDAFLDNYYIVDELAF